LQVRLSLETARGATESKAAEARQAAAALAEAEANSATALAEAESAREVRVGLYMILPSPILYAAWHTKEGSVGGASIAQWSCDSDAIG